MYLHIKCTDSDVLLVLARSLYVHKNTKFSLQSFLSKQILLKLCSFRVCNRKPDFAHLGGTGHIYVLGFKASLNLSLTCFFANTKSIKFKIPIRISFSTESNENLFRKNFIPVVLYIDS